MTEATGWRVEVRVPGRPAPQGSKNYLGGGRARESSPHLPGWRADLREGVRAALPDGWEPACGPVTALLDFAMPRPKYMVGRVTRPHLGKPDVDKLARAALDAAKDGGLLHDDSVVTGLYACKRYAEDGEAPGLRAVFTQGC